MIPVSTPPAIVIYEDCLTTETRNEKGTYRLNFATGSITGTAQVCVQGEDAVTVEITSLGCAELRSVHTSLRKKAHQRVSDLERNFIW